MKKEGNNNLKTIRNVVIIVVALIIIALIFTFAKNFMKDENVIRDVVQEISGMVGKEVSKEKEDS